MNKNKIIEAMETERKSQSIQSNNNSVKPEITTKNPHLAVCLDSNPSANNRHEPLMLKSKSLVSLVKSDNEAKEFEAFCKTLTNLDVLLDLYLFCKKSGEDNFIESLINFNKE